jgi:transposase InsO family protein
MRRAGLAGRVPKRYRRTTVGDPFTVLPDLVQRAFTPTHPDQLWVGEITDIRAWGGWLYLATVLDCFSRRVVGWAMADHLRTELPLRGPGHRGAHRAAEVDGGLTPCIASKIVGAKWRT